MGTPTRETGWNSEWGLFPMKILSNTHVQVKYRPDDTGWSGVRSVEEIVYRLGRVAAYDATAEVTVRMRNSNNTITVVFNTAFYGGHGFLMQGNEYVDTIVDAVQFKKQLHALFNVDTGEHYTFLLPDTLPHIYEQYRR